MGSGSRGDPIRTQVDSNGNTGTITNKSDSDTVKRGNLVLSKTVNGDDSSMKNFEFNIKLSSSDSKLSKLLSGKPVFGDLKFDNGEASVYLKSGESVTLFGIPVGVEYLITETVYDDYEIDWTGNNILVDNNSCSGVISEGSDVVVSCVNTYTREEEKPVDYTSLVVKKQGEGISGTFDFHAVFWNLERNTTYGMTSGTNVIEFVSDDSGIADVEFSLSSGRSVTFNKLPVGSSYQIIESENQYFSSYEISGVGYPVCDSFENSKANMSLSTNKELIQKDDKPVVVFTNSVGKEKPDDGLLSVSVQKVWNDEDNKSGLRPEYVTVYLLDDGDVIGSARLDGVGLEDDIYGFE